MQVMEALTGHLCTLRELAVCMGDSRFSCFAHYLVALCPFVILFSHERREWRHPHLCKTYPTNEMAPTCAHTIKNHTQIHTTIRGPFTVQSHVCFFKCPKCCQPHLKAWIVPATLRKRLGKRAQWHEVVSKTPKNEVRFTHQLQAVHEGYIAELPQHEDVGCVRHMAFKYERRENPKGLREAEVPLFDSSVTRTSTEAKEFLAHRALAIEHPT